MPARPVIFWFRRDLRLEDQPALAHAARVADGAGVIGVFVGDPKLLEPAGTTRAKYLVATLDSLDSSVGGALCVRFGDPTSVLSQIAVESGAATVVATADHGPYGRRRDEEVSERLRAQAIRVEFFDSNYVVAPGTVRKADGTPFRVFTPFQRAWRSQAVTEPGPVVTGMEWLHLDSEGASRISDLVARRRPWYFGDLDDDPAPRPPIAGAPAAMAALATFSTRVDGYATHRDIPGDDATSRLSAALRFGALHPRQVLAATRGAGPGRDTFSSEIAWREFYADVLWHHPESARESVQTSMRALRVDSDEFAAARFRTWARGETGFELVDAGMRQLLEEGWMHNRVRMVAASFLVKHLHVDWRWGARWFMWRLADGDLASNQHGWQWTAGTGTDAAPYHRIFNPILQAQRYDPDRVYARRYIDELDDLFSSAAHTRTKSRSSAPYPEPMINISAERIEALARFAEARANARGGS